MSSHGRRMIIGALALLLGVTTVARAQTVAQAVASMGPCQSHLVRGLSDQVLRTHLCSFPDTLVPFSHRNISMNSGVYAYGTPEMVAALYRAADGGGLHVNSAFRTVVVQYAFDETDHDGNDDGCFNPASPGNSRHEWGNAVDLADAGTVAPRMRAAGFTWWGPDGIGVEWDYPHFTAGPERAGFGVRAFQRLWNINNPGDRIAEDGSFGPMTLARLRASPAAGFPMEGCGPVCDGTGDDDECGVRLLLEQPAAYIGTRSSDVDGDGLADLCARGGAGVRCWPATPTGWPAEWAPIPWSDDSGWDDVTNYATLRMGDVNGDRRADVCARSNADFLCALASDGGFEPATAWRAGLSDANGWDAPMYFTTLRLADVNGDGKDDLCGRDSQGFGCWLSDGVRFDQRVEGPRWSNDAGFTLAKYYGTLRMADLNADRRADVCIRGADGVGCALSDGAGFPTSVTGPEWSDASGFDQIEYWSTLRMVDVSADGRADLCVRTSADLRCVFASDDGFGETVTVAALSNESGWADPSNYATLRTGDIDGDGGADLCLRSNSRVTCWLWDGAAFTTVDGPEWSDDTGWDDAAYYQTIRLADFDGDGLDDLCARASSGWRCHPSMGDSFGDPVALDELTDAGGWDAPQYGTTVMSAGRACRAEMEACNGLDDDCDGMVDEHVVDEICNATDDDCDGTVDEGLSCVPVPGSDGAVMAPDGAVLPDGGTGPTALHAGCTCRAGGGGRSSAAWLGLALFAALAWRRARRPQRRKR